MTRETNDRTLVSEGGDYPTARGDLMAFKDGSGRDRVGKVEHVNRRPVTPVECTQARAVELAEEWGGGRILLPAGRFSPCQVCGFLVDEDGGEPTVTFIPPAHKQPRTPGSTPTLLGLNLPANTVLVGAGGHATIIGDFPPRPWWRRLLNRIRRGRK